MSTSRGSKKSNSKIIKSVGIAPVLLAPKGDADISLFQKWDEKTAAVQGHLVNITGRMVLWALAVVGMAALIHKLLG
jgi:hypothetical protein